MRGKTFLKIAGIIMIIGGILGIILGIVALIGVAALAYMIEDSAGSVSLLYLATGLALISGIIELIAGIVGVKNCAKPEKAVTCIVLGTIVAVLCIVGQVLNVSNGVDINVTTIITGLALPVLYIIGAVMTKMEMAK